MSIVQLLVLDASSWYFKVHRQWFDASGRFSQL